MIYDEIKIPQPLSLFLCHIAAMYLIPKVNFKLAHVLDV